MEFIKAILKKIKHIIKLPVTLFNKIFNYNKKWIIFIVIITSLLGIKFITSFMIKNYKVEFYPLESTEKELSRVYDFFKKGEYTTLTSYTEQTLLLRLPHDVRKDMLFWQAESYFQEAQYPLAKKKFSLLNKEFPEFWQARLRLASIAVLENHIEQFSQLTYQLPKSNELYYWEGRYLETLGDIPDALAHYYSSNTDDPRVAFRIGNILFNQKQFAKAIPFLEKVLTHSFQTIPTLRLLFFSAVEISDTQQMLKYYNALKPYFFDNIDLARSVAAAFYEKGYLEQARGVYLILSNERMTKEIAYTLLNINFEMKEYKNVMQYAQYISADDPSMLRVIEAAYLLSQYNKAIANINRYLQAVDNKISAGDRKKLMNIQADSYKYLQKYPLAINIRLSIDKHNPDIHNALELLELYRRVHNISALTQFTKQVYSQYSEYKAQILKILFSVEEYKFAQTLLTQDIEKTPTSEYFLFAQAQIYAGEKNWEQLRKTLHTLLQNNPTDEEIIYKANYALGSLYIQNKNYVQAKVFMESAKDVKDVKEVNIRLLMIYYLGGFYSKALEQIKVIKTIEKKEIMTEEEKSIISKIENGLQYI